MLDDGPLQFGTFSAAMFKGFTEEQIDHVVAANFLDKGNFLIEQNALVVNTGAKLVLIDTGLGLRKVYGPRSGHLLGNLRAAGIDPTSFDVVALSHAHPDHVSRLGKGQIKLDFLPHGQCENPVLLVPSTVGAFVWLSPPYFALC